MTPPRIPHERAAPAPPPDRRGAAQAGITPPVPARPGAPLDPRQEDAPGPHSPPAGNAYPRAAGAPAGALTWTLEFPPGLPVASLNDRGHWAQAYRRKRVLKDAATVMARKARLPRLARARITLEYQPPDRRPRDADNLAATLKPLIDGIVAAGVLPDDSTEYVSVGGPVVGPVFPKGRIVLRIEGEPAP